MFKKILTTLGLVILFNVLSPLTLKAYCTDDKFTMPQFTQQYEPHTPPPILVSLFKFHDGHKAGYSQALYLECFDGKHLLRTYSEEPSFLNAFIEFAYATISGSTYAFWLQENMPLEQTPIVLFGDDGGIEIIANNINDLLKLSSYDIEPSILFEKVYFTDRSDKDYIHHPSRYIKAYNKWLNDEWKITPITHHDEIENIVKNSHDRYDEKLKIFLASYGIE